MCIGIKNPTCVARIYQNADIGVVGSFNIIFYQETLSKKYKLEISYCFPVSAKITPLIKGMSLRIICSS
jgi:hypothetical protein